MDRANLLAEAPDATDSLLPCGKEFETPLEGNATKKNDASSTWLSSGRSLHLLSPTGLIRPRPCCQSRPVRFMLWILRGTILFFVFSFVIAILRPSYTNPPAHYKSLEQHVLSSADHGRGNVKNEKIYIAANIINEKLIRGPWGASLHELVDLLGEDNVFVSIYENDSGKASGDALRELQQDLKCNTSIVTGAHLPLSDFPRIRLPDGRQRVQRITYLSEVRNQLLRPLDPAFASSNFTNGFRSASDIHFDRVLFLNDVYFRPLDAVQLLLSTNEGNYRTACAADFVHGPQYYDTFATRDYDGYSMGLMLYPWFAPIGSSISRNDVRQQTDAVRVRSCWGGMAAFEASVFRPILEHDAHCTSQEGSCLPLHFRGSNEPFWEAAECCLIFADIEQLYGRSDRVFLNPYIRVAYTKLNFDLIPLFRRFERFFAYLQYFISKNVYPSVNLRRTHEVGDLVNQMVWTEPRLGPVKSTSTLRGHTYSTDNDLTTPAVVNPGHWSVVSRTATPGGFCGQRNMFVMKDNLEEANENVKEESRNWDKIPVPRIGW